MPNMPIQILPTWAEMEWQLGNQVRNVFLLSRLLHLVQRNGGGLTCSKLVELSVCLSDALFMDWLVVF